MRLIHHELIGLDLSVKDSTNPDMIGLQGRVIDETRNTLVIESEGEEKVIPKSHSTFLFTLLNGEQVEVEGKLFILRPEDRIDC